MSCLCSMAYLDMYNQNSNEEQKPLGVGAPSPTATITISPRISFSNDFVESSTTTTTTTTTHSNSHHPQMARVYRDAPVSSDFEFSVSNYSMMSADELFSQGRLLPLKENCHTNQFHKTTTLRDELLQVEDDDDDDNFSLRPPKSSTRWKGFLGLKKSHIGSKKIDKTEGSRSAFAHGEAHSGKPPQEMLNDGGSSSKMNEDQFRL